MQKITPYLWFDNNGEEAMNFYASVFKDTKVGNVSRITNDEGKEVIVSGTFELFGQEFMFLNGGPMFKFTEAVSFFVSCENQEEVDEYWDKLTDGGSAQPCGWLKDKFGLSWQIIPKQLGEMLQDHDPAKAKRVMEAMLTMSKIVVADLQKAYDDA